MIDIPIGKALVAVEGKYCDGCSFEYHSKSYCNNTFSCMKEERKDGKDVVYKIVDYKRELRDCENCYVSPDDCNPSDCEMEKEEQL